MIQKLGREGVVESLDGMRKLLPLYEAEGITTLDEIVDAARVEAYEKRVGAIETYVTRSDPLLANVMKGYYALRGGLAEKDPSVPYEILPEEERRGVLEAFIQEIKNGDGEYPFITTSEKSVGYLARVWALGIREGLPPEEIGNALYEGKKQGAEEYAEDLKKWVEKEKEDPTLDDATFVHERIWKDGVLARFMVGEKLTPEEVRTLSSMERTIALQAIKKSVRKGEEFIKAAVSEVDYLFGKPEVWNPWGRGLIAEFIQWYSYMDVSRGMPEKIRMLCERVGIPLPWEVERLEYAMRRIEDAQYRLNAQKALIKGLKDLEEYIRNPSEGEGYLREGEDSLRTLVAWEESARDAYPAIRALYEILRTDPSEISREQRRWLEKARKLTGES